MDNLLNKVVSFLCLFLLFAGGYYLYTNIEFETVLEKLPPDAKVLNNPYYAAQELIRKSGYQVYDQADYSLSKLPVDGTLLALNPESIKKDGQSLQIQQWIKDGGHLVIGIGRTSYYSLPDFLNIKANRRSSNECSKQQDRSNCYEWLTVNSSKLSASVNRLTAFTLGNGSVWTVPSPRDNKRLLLARYSIGNGTVTIVQSEWFKNDTISHYHHAKILLELVTFPDRQRPIYLLEYGTYPNIFSWLAQNAPYSVISFISLIIVLLWHYMPRFGAVVQTQQQQRPQLTEHLKAIGQYQINHHNYDALLASLRNEVKTLIEPFKLYYPDVASPERLIERITQVNLTEIVTVMNNAAHSQSEFTRHVAILSLIINKIKLAKSSDIQNINSGKPQ